MNHEGYSDPTADVALGNIERKESRLQSMPPGIRRMFHALDAVAALKDLEVVSVRDRKTGREWRRQ